MTRKIKSIICLMLAMVMMATVFVLPAGAADSGEVNIVFYKPDNWGDNVKIHLWNAGNLNTQWPGVAMTKRSDGTFSFSTSEISSCNFVINDSNGNQTSDLYANGYVGVKDNKTFARSKDRITVFFKKPADWSSDVKMYYYSNDDNQIALKPWPGVSMSKPFYNTDSYYGTITDMADVRVLFTDGTHQYPAQNQPGIPVKAGQELIYQDGKYTTAPYTWITIKQPTSGAMVGATYQLDISMTQGDDFPLYFYDEDHNAIDPVNQTEVRENGKCNRKYYFNFAQAGEKTIYVYYYYHSSMGYTGSSFNVKVSGNTNYDYRLVSDKYTLNVGETYTLRTYNDGETYYRFYDENHNRIEYNYVSYTSNYTYYTFTANKLGKGQKIYSYISNRYNPSYEMSTGDFVTLDVWQNAY